MRRRPFFGLFVTPAAVTALVFTAALVAVLQYSVRKQIPGSLDVGGPLRILWRPSRAGLVLVR